MSPARMGAADDASGLTYASGGGGGGGGGGLGGGLEAVASAAVTAETTRQSTTDSGKVSNVLFSVEHAQM